MSLAPEWRLRVEEYVRPLHTELDGVETFSRVERLERRLADLATGLSHDARHLELLTLFHGVVDRLGSLANGGRWQLFLRGLGLAPEEIARLRGGLDRYAEEPRTVEEELLHDAVLLDRCGVEAVLTALLAAGRRRWTLDRALSAIDAGPEPARFRSPRGRQLAAERYAAAERWLMALERELAAERELEGLPPAAAASRSPRAGLPE